MRKLRVAWPILAVTVIAGCSEDNPELSGVIVDSLTEVPLAQCEVIAADSGETALSDDHGAFSFEFEQNSPIGQGAPFDLVISRDGYDSTTLSLEDIRENSQPLRVLLQPEPLPNNVIVIDPVEVHEELN